MRDGVDEQGGVAERLAEVGDGDEVGGLGAERDDEAGAGVGEGGVLAALEQEVAEGSVAAGQHGGGVEWLVLGGVGVTAQLVQREGGRPGLAVVAGIDRRAGLDEHLDGGAGRRRGGRWRVAAAGEQRQREGGTCEVIGSSPHIRVRRGLRLRQRSPGTITGARVHLQFIARVDFS